jgi:hypothetical protein
MKKPFVSLFCLGITIGLSSSQINAQGFLQKLKEKAESVAGGSGTGAKPSKALYEKQKEDASKNVLEAKGITKDPYGLAGIYYTRELFVCGKEEGKPDKAIGKFLVSFEKEANAVKVKLTPSYGIEENVPF